ncbi:MAG TPA: hypothetical protein EYP85_10055 [Armatimonadetes bacterium]|nr:hypothetical protein [Armatimonadota bacterium]
MMFRDSLDLHIRARYPLLYIPTAEEQRVEEEIVAVARREQPPRQVHVWDAARGYDGTQAAPGLPLPALEEVENSPPDEPALFILRDFHVYLSDPQVARKLRNLARRLRGERKTIILVSPVLKVPDTLAEEITVLDFPLPTAAEIGQTLEMVCSVSIKPNSR